MATEQLKQQMIKELDDLELKTERGMYWVRLDSVRDIVNSLIDKTVQMTEERIVGEIEKMEDRKLQARNELPHDGYEQSIGYLEALKQVIRIIQEK